MTLDSDPESIISAMGASTNVAGFAVPLQDAIDETLYGGKCASLARALRAGLPAPGGFALSVALVKRIAQGAAADFPEIAALFPLLAPAMAARSSAVGEDSNDASFAGQHLSVLNIMNADAMMAAIVDVFASAHTPEALAYRSRMQVPGEPAIAVALQKQILSESAGVMFTRNPLSGAEERYIEASWGLGEAIVAGLVVPDSFRLSADGSVLESTAGEKDLMLVAEADGTVVEMEVEGERIESLCLSTEQLGQLHELASNCQNIYGRDIDIEWAFYQGQLYLLQCRGITR